MASTKKPRKSTLGRTPPSMTEERSGARYRIRPISPVGGGHQGGLITPSGVGKANL